MTTSVLESSLEVLRLAMMSEMDLEVPFLEVGAVSEGLGSEAWLFPEWEQSGGVDGGVLGGLWGRTS